MSAINVNSITGRTGTHGPVLTGVTTVSDALVVGGTDSTAKLNVFGGDIQIGTGLTVKSSSSTGNINLQGGYTYPGGWIKLSGGSSDDNIVFGTSSNTATKEEKVRINSDGNVGIGTDNPLRQLQIHSDAAETVALQLTNQGTGATNDNSGFTLKIGSVGQVNLDQRTPGQDIIVFTNGVERMRVGSVGVCTFVNDVHIFDGNLVVASGHGIDFSATSDGSGTTTSEIFDDYEEGTWTATLSSSGGGLVYTVDNSTGYYTKIGDVVHAWWYSNAMNIINNGTGSARLAGLPFNSASLTNNYGVVSTTHNTAFTPATDFGYVATNNDQILFQPTGSTASSNWTQSSGASLYLMIHAVYKAT